MKSIPFFPIPYPPWYIPTSYRERPLWFIELLGYTDLNLFT